MHGKMLHSIITSGWCRYGCCKRMDKRDRKSSVGLMRTREKRTWKKDIAA